MKATSCPDGLGVMHIPVLESEELSDIAQIDDGQALDVVDCVRSQEQTTRYDTIYTGPRIMHHGYSRTRG